MAIPLFHDTARAEHLTVDSFVKALDTNLIQPETFDASFPVKLPTLRDPGQFQKTPGEYVSQYYSRKLSEMKLSVDQLQTEWTKIRSTFKADQTNQRDQAKNVFDAGIQTGGGRMQTAKHYYALLLWHQQRVQQGRDALNRCSNTATGFVTTASAALEDLQKGIEKLGVSSDFMALLDSNREKDERVYSAYSDALSACQLTNYDQSMNELPERLSFADTLGRVGAWTRWLLDTENMAVVIIVGLVGFSLLGATVSRAVRLGDDKLQAALTFDDLLIVVSGGTTAAVVVFLAAYGGLALLGSSSGDPNPYVLFVTCLIGAVYSEDVWTWARRKLLSSATSTNGHQDKARAGDGAERLQNKADLP